MTTLADRVAKAMEFDSFRAEQKAERLAEGWADFSRLPEDEKEVCVGEYLSIATDEKFRTKELVAALVECVSALEKREQQIVVAIECLEKYRTLCISHGVGARETPTYRLGVHAEEALNLMAAINQKFKVGSALTALAAALEKVEGK